jgi:hypothetical protein
LADKPSITDTVLDKISERIGSSESLQRIKFGRGAVGKIAVVAVACAVATGAVAFHISPTGELAVLGVIGIIFIGSILAILRVIDKQPELAVLEGMELVRYKQVTIGSKDYVPLLETLPVPDPKLAIEIKSEDGK